MQMDLMLTRFKFRESTVKNSHKEESTMGTKVGKQKDSKFISGLTIEALNQLVVRGGKEKQKALTELAKRGLNPI